MEFKEKKAIYAQIADYFNENILQKRWREDDRIPSVREMAVEMEVNPNTVQRAYSLLQDEGIIQNRRGVGYFVSEQAYRTVKKMKREEFMDEVLPDFFRNLALLDIDFSELRKLYDDYLKKEELHAKQ